MKLGKVGKPKSVKIATALHNKVSPIFVTPYFYMKYGIFGCFFGFFSSLVCPIELILFSLGLHFSPDRFRHPYIGFTTTFFFGPIMVKSKK